MKRKIIKQAGQAFTLTLPIQWIRENKLSEKSEVNLSIKGNSILIESDSHVFGAKATLHYEEGSERNLGVQIHALYAKGIDEIEIISKKDISSLIINALKGTIGMALVNQDKERYVIKEISGNNSADLDEIFKRVFQMIMIFLDNAINDIFGEEKQTLEDLKMRDLEVNKFSLYLQRAINKKSYSDEVNGRTLFTYSFALEKIADEVERAWRTNIKYKVKKVKGLNEFCEEAKEVLEIAFDLYYQFNPGLIEKSYKKRDALREKSISFVKIDPITTRFIRHMLKIAEDSTDLNQLALMRRL